MAFNRSNGSYPNDTAATAQDLTYRNNQVLEPDLLKTFRRIIFSLVILGALIGNSVVIRAVRSGRSRKPFTNYLVTSLAVAELLNSFFLVFIFVQEEIYYWVFGGFMCHVVVSGAVITFSVTTTTLACISLYRYRVLVTPYKKAPSSRTCMIVIAVIWTYSFVFAMPVVVTTEIQIYAIDDNMTLYKYCLPKNLSRTYSLARVVCQFFIPVIIMFISYSFASVKIKEHMSFIENRRQDRANSNISTLNTYLDSQVYCPTDNNLLTVPLHPAPPEIPLQTRSSRGSFCHGRNALNVSQPTPHVNSSTNQSGEEGHMIETERDIIKMFYVIVLVFVICYIPYQLFFMLEYFSVIEFQTFRHYNIVRNITFLLISFPSALHPLCYGTMSQFYAQAFAKIVLCKCRK